MIICHKCKNLIVDSGFSVDIKDENGKSVNDTMYICDDCCYLLQKFLAGEDDEDFEDEWDW